MKHACIRELLKSSFNTFTDNTAITQLNSKGEADSITFGKLGNRAGKILGILNDRLLAGQSIGLYMQRSTEQVAAIVGSIFSDNAYSSINHMVTANQVMHIVESGDVGVLFCDNTTLLKLRSLVSNNHDWAYLNKLKIIHLRNGEVLKPVFEQTIELLSESVSIESIDLNTQPAVSLEQSTTSQPSDTKLILFTSGSTGNPKGVQISSVDLVKRIEHESKSYELNSNDRLLNMLPFSFDVGCNQLLCSLANGCNLVILNSWMPADILNAIKKQEITGVSGVPSLWLSVINSNADDIDSTVEKLRYITISGGDMNTENRLQLKQVFKGIKIYKTYGQTETFRTSMLMADDFDSKHESVGKAVDGVNIFIIDKDKNVISKAFEVGEIVHSGTGMMNGYISDEAASSKKLNTFSDSDNKKVMAVFTGDLGYLDDNGFLYIQGRQDRMFKIRGNRIYPEEIEKEICKHEEVVESVAHNDKDNETVIVFARKKAESSITDDDLRKYINPRLPSYMAPGKIFIYDDFPRTASGKINVPSLIEEYQGKTP